MLEVVDIHTYYGESHVVQGASLKVAAGSAVALLGRNGMGKTTIIRSIMSFTPARHGEIIFNGQEITNGSELWGTPYKDLIMEVARAIANWSVLTAGDVRNLRLVSAGSTGGTTSTADNA